MSAATAVHQQLADAFAYHASRARRRHVVDSDAEAKDVLPRLLDHLADSATPAVAFELRA